jgi:hypothetical protein
VDATSLNDIFSQISDEIEREEEQVSIKDWMFISSGILLAVNIYIIYGKYKIVV